jgi:hypothetical protein
MLYRWLADGLVTVHAAFVAFVVLGSLAAIRWPRVAWIEFTGWICPLTPLENAWRIRAGEAGYRGGFVEHYLLHMLYPPELTRSTQWALGAAVLVLNVLAYAIAYRRWQGARGW